MTPSLPRAILTTQLHFHHSAYVGTAGSWNCFKGNIGDISERWAGAQTGFFERTDTTMDWTKLMVADGLLVLIYSMEGRVTQSSSEAQLKRPAPYHWQEVPQVSFLLRQKCFVATNITLSRQAYKHAFVVTKVLSQQKWYLWRLPPMTGSGQPKRVRAKNSKQSEELTHPTTISSPYLMASSECGCECAGDWVWWYACLLWWPAVSSWASLLDSSCTSPASLPVSSSTLQTLVSFHLSRVCVNW